MSGFVDEPKVQRVHPPNPAPAMEPESADNYLRKAAQPANPHPRDILMRELSDYTETMIDELAIVREARALLTFCSREEADRLLKFWRLAQIAAHRRL